jgi:hypothetical protein
MPVPPGASDRFDETSGLTLLQRSGPAGMVAPT